MADHLDPDLFSALKAALSPGDVVPTLADGKPNTIGEVTVGTHVCVSHSGAAMAGEDVVVTCTLDTIEKRRLTFGVKVTAPSGVISEGTHQRAVINANRFG